MTLFNTLMRVRMQSSIFLLLNVLYAPNTLANQIEDLIKSYLAEAQSTHFNKTGSGLIITEDSYGTTATESFYTVPIRNSMFYTVSGSTHHAVLSIDINDPVYLRLRSSNKRSPLAAMTYDYAEPYDNKPWSEPGFYFNHNDECDQQSAWFSLREFSTESDDSSDSPNHISVQFSRTCYKFSGDLITTHGSFGYRTHYPLSPIPALHKGSYLTVPQVRVHNLKGKVEYKSLLIEVSQENKHAPIDPRAYSYHIKAITPSIVHSTKIISPAAYDSRKGFTIPSVVFKSMSGIVKEFEYHFLLSDPSTFKVGDTLSLTGYNTIHRREP